MAITKNIVDMMNGEIQVDSEKNVGTTFTVTVTLKISSRSVRQEQSGLLPQGLRILVVDDDEVACEHAKLVASAIGAEAEALTNPELALREIAAARKQGQPYDFVLTDYKMPGIDGIEMARAIRSTENDRTAVIVLTGYSWNDIQAEAAEAGVDGIMSKPLFTDSLIREIRHILDRRSTQTEQGDPLAVPDTAEYAERRIAGTRVLVAEDVEINADILMDLLEMEGVESELAENGRIATEMFSASAPDYYDAVLMDMQMPEMDGLEATRVIRGLDRKDAKTIPIIALTANAFAEDVQRSLQAGMTAHLSKPVEPERLYDTLDQLIHKGGHS